MNIAGYALFCHAFNYRIAFSNIFSDKTHQI